MEPQDNIISQSRPVRILSDHPVEMDAGFGFNSYIKTIADLIAFNQNKTPLTIGIYGSWGTGKTTLMKSIKHRLDTDKRYERDTDFRNCKTMWFQPWKYGKQEEILAALIEEIFLTMENDGLFNAGKAGVEKIVQRLKGIKLFEKFVENLTTATTTIKVNDIFGELPHKNRLGFYDVFQKFFKDLIWTYLNWRPKLNKFEETDDQRGAFVIFIDDLDRCPRDRIVGVLESIKLFLDLEGCIFVLGAANEIIVKALRETYREDADAFMDKIVQVTFNLPKIPSPAFITYLEDLEDFGMDGINELLPVLIPALDHNPRNLKRFLNNLSLMETLLINKAVTINKQSLLLWQIIEYRYSGFRNFIRKNEHGNIEIMQQVIDQHKQGDGPFEVSTFSAKMAEEIKRYDALKPYFEDPELVVILDKLRCSKNEIEELVTLTGMVERVEDVKRKKDDKKRAPLDGMTQVPAGEFLYGESKQTETIEKGFEIDIYPVTNDRYKKFIAAGGYSNKAYWDDNGWEWKNKENISQPEFLSDETYNDPEQPVVGVSFYEAEAFCRWLTKSRDDGYEYRLPDEKEWEKAARGEDGRIYPWGDEFDSEKCNTEKSGIEAPTRVSKYSNGISPYGCYDMAGNVLEWTSSYKDGDKDFFVLRGGAFLGDAFNCRCAARGSLNPDERDLIIGFRCTRIKL